MRTHAVSLCSRVPEFLPLLNTLDREPPRSPPGALPLSLQSLPSPAGSSLSCVSFLTPRLSGGWGETHMWAKEQHCHPTSSWVLTYNRKHQAGASVAVFSRHCCRASWQGASRHCQPDPLRGGLQERSAAVSAGLMCWAFPSEFLFISPALQQALAAHLCP